MRRPKVLFISPWYPSPVKPVTGLFVQEYAKAVLPYCDVQVLHCAGRDRQLRGLWRMEQDDDPEMNQGIPTYRAWYRGLPQDDAAYPLHLWSTLQAFRRIISLGFQPDIIHAHVYKVAVPAGILGKLYRTPVVITEHATAFPRKTLRRTHVWTARLGFRWAHLVMPVSRSLQQAIESYGIRARFRVVPNVVDTSLFNPEPVQPDEPHKRLLFVGAMRAKKGLPYLFHALALLRRKRSDWHLDLIGEDPERNEYGRLVAELGLDDCVSFAGPKSKPEVADYMRRCHFFVLPSLFETFGVVLIEALAAGRPVVATRIGGPDEIVTEDVGVLVPPGDAEALSAAIDHMLDHYHEFSPKALHAYVEQRYSYRVIGQELADIYDAALGGQHASRTAGDAESPRLLDNP
ncbi:glycosyltransferase [Chloroflexota bacterium]